MKKFISALMIGTIALALTSCSDDDDKNSGSITKPSYVITHITYPRDVYTTENVEINYDSQGRITGSRGGYFGWTDFSYSYSEDKILCSVPGEDNTTFNLSEGLVANFGSEGKIKYTYSYNGRELKDLGWVGSDYYSLIWSNGLIVSYSDDESETENIEYADINGINKDAAKTVNAILISDEIEDEYPWTLAINGYMGTVPERPISKIGTTQISYGTLDGNGCPSSYTIKDQYEEKTYNLTWKKL